MDGRRDLFDASAYILFEACGDSEIECFDRTIGGAFVVESDAEEAEDDAQSCSNESLPVSTREDEVDELDGDRHFCGADFVRVGEYFSAEDGYRVEEEDSGPDSDEEDGVVDQCRRRCMSSAAEETVKDKFKKSNGREDWTLSEQERGRLFWDNCLGS